MRMRPIAAATALILTASLAAGCGTPEPTLGHNELSMMLTADAPRSGGRGTSSVAAPSLADNARSTVSAADSAEAGLQSTHAVPPADPPDGPRELLLEFHPQHATGLLDFRPEEATPIAAPQPGDPAPPAQPLATDANPPLVTIDGDVVYADAFVDRCFRMHHEWYLMFLREMMVERMAALESAREGIEFSDAELDAVHANVVAFLQQRARRLQMSWRQHWETLGYETEAAYIAALRTQTARIVRLERLVMLMDLRLSKVDFSWIMIRDKPDRMNPDPEARARHIVSELRAGTLAWDAAVRRHTTDARSRDTKGKFGTIVRGSLGVEDLENWLFSHSPGEISDPLLHPVYGWIIARVDDATTGQPDITWEQAKETVQQRLDQQEGVPGTRVTGRDTFIWLERIIASKRYPVRSYAPRPASGEPRVAEVNNVPLTLGQFVDHAFANNPDWARQILSEVIVFRVATTEAAREGIDVNSMVSTGTDRMLLWLRNSARSRQQNFDEIWQNQGYASIDEFREKVISPLVAESLRIERLVFLHDRRVERRELWHILLQSEELAKKAKQALAEGHKFEDVAKYYSQHKASAQRGGLLGIIPIDSYDEAFSKVAFSLPLNGVSEPLQTAQGWHVIRVTKIIPANPGLTWGAAQDEIEKALEGISPIPGQRIVTADTYRWIAAIRKTDRHKIEPHFPR
ncbi:MAG: peptidylprolyl isomerase [Planctomycetota bacterium]